MVQERPLSVISFLVTVNFIYIAQAWNGFQWVRSNPCQLLRLDSWVSLNCWKCVWVFCLHFCQCTSGMHFPQRPEEGVDSGTGKKNWLWVAIWMLGIKRGSFRIPEQPVLLTAETSLTYRCNQNIFQMYKVLLPSYCAQLKCYILTPMRRVLK